MKQLIFKSTLLILGVFFAFNANAQNWLTAGNVVTPGQFVGSTNNRFLEFRTNNVEKMRIGAGQSDVLIGIKKSTSGANVYRKLEVVDSIPTTYGADVAINTKTSANGTTGVGSAEAGMAASSSWSAAGTFYGVTGTANVTKATAPIGHSSSCGGVFSAVLNNATLSSTGTYTNKVAGTRGILSGTVASYANSGYVAAVAGEDLINHATKTFAGYFVGKTYCTAGTWHSSDRRFKKDITVIGNALDRVVRLRGVQYEYDLDKFADRSFTAGKTDGFIAQELREVLPELVLEGPDGYLAVNYEGVIPVLTEAIKDLKNEKDMEISELETRVADKDRQINALEARLAKLEAAFDRAEAAPAKAQNFLMSNQPNPFSGSTTVKISIPESVQVAELVVTDLAGKEIARRNVAERGQASVEVNMQTAPAGTYICTLIADGQNAGTLKLALNGK